MLKNTILNCLHFQETISRELVDQYLEAAADFCENELSPINQSGDREGCTLE